jgi:hypothetical protein
MKTKYYLTKSGFQITTQVVNDKINHFYIRDTNLYPDSDSRSEEWWRQSGNVVLIPINDKKDWKKIKKLFK